MNKVFCAVSCILVLNSGHVLAQQSQSRSYRPLVGYVPDADTAIKIAVAVWSPIYGKQMIQHEKPFHAKLAHGIWTVTGSLFRPRGNSRLVGGKGGVALAEIAKQNGCILRVIHGK